MFILEARGTRSSQSSQGPRAAASWWLNVKRLGAGAVGIVWLCSLCLWKGTWKEEGSGGSLHPGVDLSSSLSHRCQGTWSLWKSSVYWTLVSHLTSTVWKNLAFVFNHVKIGFNS